MIFMPVILKKYLIGLLLINLILLIAVYLLSNPGPANIHLGDAILLALCFSAINILSVSIFSRGIKRDPESQTMHLMVAISIKLPLEMVLALIWFFVAKKTYASSVLLFFVLYLALSLYSISCILKTLKHNSL
jgi:hypothetical protein